MRRVIGLAAGLMLVVSVAALAHWDPGGCYKMHYLQLPIDLVDPGSNGLDVSFAPALRWADDWLCIESGYVTDIHLWVSWQGDQIQPIGAITVRIWSDNPEGPGGFSIPGALLFDRDLGPGDFVVRNMDDHLQDWFTPWTGDYFLSDHVLWQQINIVDIEDPFYQEEGNIYWLEIDVPVIETVGWKVSGSEHFRDNAVYWRGDHWEEQRHPGTNDSLDLAFVITSRHELTYSWEDGGATVLGTYGDVVNPANVAGMQVGQVAYPGTTYTCPGAYDGDRYLHLAESPHSGTPQAYLACITGLQAGDSVYARFRAYDLTPGAFPSVRIWAHYSDAGTSLECPGNYTGSASGNPDYSAGDGWDPLEYGWIFPADRVGQGLVIEARLYSSPATCGECLTDYWIDLLTLSVPGHAHVLLPDMTGASTAESTSWSRIKKMFR